MSILGYLAAKTDTMELGSGIFNIYGRTPSTIAMTAAGLDAVSSGRFILGLGASGPQVIEGFHGVKYDKPLGRQREIMEICRAIWRREVVVHDGPNYQLPLPQDQGTGLGKPLKLINHPVREDIPIYLASLGPKNVELTAEVADGWLPAFFHPDKADGGGRPISTPASPSVILPSARSRSRPVAHCASPTTTKWPQDPRRRSLHDGAVRRRHGREGQNFYNNIFRKYGYEQEAEQIQDLYLGRQEGRGDGARPPGLPRRHGTRR